MHRHFDGILRFEGFELDLTSRELSHKGSRIPIQLQPVRLLSYLALHPGAAISREALRNHLWSERTFVDFESGLNFCIRQIRKALNDDARHPRLLETLNRRGYRFLAPVERVPAAPAADAPEHRITVTVRPQRGHADDARMMERMVKEITQLLVSLYSAANEPAPCDVASMRPALAAHRFLSPALAGTDKLVDAMLGAGVAVNINRGLAGGEFLAVLRVE
jgi:DNA-binding winged helix-turn-helix (wHTH) protein